MHAIVHVWPLNNITKMSQQLDTYFFSFKIQICQAISKEKVTKLLHASSFKSLFHHKTGTKT